MTAKPDLFPSQKAGDMKPCADSRRDSGCVAGNSGCYYHDLGEGKQICSACEEYIDRKMKGP